MYNSYYQSAVPEQQMVNQAEEIDYSFSRLPVRERRKLFQDDQVRIVSQYGTLPRGPASRSAQHAMSQSDANIWQTPTRPTFLTYTQASPRRNSTQEYVATPRQHFTPTFTSNRQSRPVYKSQYSSPMVIQAGDQPQLHAPLYQTNPPNVQGTRVFRRSSVTPYSHNQRDTVSVTREIWPSRQQSQQQYQQYQPPPPPPLQNPADQCGKPLWVRVYNSDRSASSPAHSQAPAVWGQASPVYAAYPAYGPRPTSDRTQMYRVIPDSPRVYPQTISNSVAYMAPQQTAQIYVPLSPSHRHTKSMPYKSPTPVPVGHTLRGLQPPSPSRPQRNDWAVLQPTKIEPVSSQPRCNQPATVRQQPMRTSLYQQPRAQQAQQAPPPPPHHQRSATLPSRPRPKVVNRRTPPPDNEVGVTEF